MFTVFSSPEKRTRSIAGANISLIVSCRSTSVIMDEEKAGTPTDPKTQEEAVPAAPAEVYNPGAKAPLTKKSFWRVLIR